MNGFEFHVDPSRCIGCRACMAVCAECDSHRWHSMIHVDAIDPRQSTAMDRTRGSSTTPLWAEEFSVHSAENAYVLRRQFTKFLVLTSLAMTTGNGWIWMRSLFAAPEPLYPELVVAAAADVPPGGVKLFRYPSEIDSAILVRKTDGSLVAYSQKCTHLSCAVFYSAEHDRLECPCHTGYFSVHTGRVLQGPPPRPRPRIRLEERAGMIVATGVDLQGDHE